MSEIEVSDEDIKNIVERVIIEEDKRVGGGLRGINNKIEDIIKDEITGENET